jgi:NAD(P)-dependent dehydrogenase (short-subunit alcohol dehydrogenase family)
LARTEPYRMALVTGGNRGIGYEVCRQLARRGIHVLLTSRNAKRGRAAANQLAREGLSVVPHTLDVTDPSSIKRALAFVRTSCKRLDILVNNAGVYLDDDDSILDVDAETIDLTLRTNLIGALQLSQAFAPMMQHQRFGRIVNVSSGMGAFNDLDGTAAAYRLSKAALNAMTVMLADALQADGIKVNAACPGWVHTEMGGPQAPRTPAQGADTIVWLALLPERGPSGGFFRDRKRIPW